MDGPTAGEWWMVLITDADTGDTFGDVAIHVGAEGRSAEVGYTLAAEYWGRGYLTEAMEAVVEYLFGGLGFVRVSATLHRDNVASARALERCGFVTKAALDRRIGWTTTYRTISSTGWCERTGSVANSGTRPRPQGPIGRDHSANARDRCGIFVRTSRRIASLHRSPIRSPTLSFRTSSTGCLWFRGFGRSRPTKSWSALRWWRCLPTTIPNRICGGSRSTGTHQRRGIGSMALAIIEDELRSMGDDTLLVSWGRAEARPARSIWLEASPSPGGSSTEKPKPASSLADPGGDASNCGLPVKRPSRAAQPGRFENMSLRRARSHSPIRAITAAVISSRSLSSSATCSESSSQTSRDFSPRSR